MDRKEIIEEFFRHGWLLSPSALSLLEGMPDKSILSLSRKDYPELVIQEEDIRSRMTEFREIFILKEIKRELSVEDFIRIYRQKFEKIRSILLERYGDKFISIGNLGSSGREVYVIGMVKDKAKGRFVIEDMTGKVEVIGDAEVEIDDVVAVKGREGNNSILLSSVIYPDIPIREPKTGKGKVLVLSGVNLDEAPKEYEERLKEIIREHDMPVLICGYKGSKSLLEERDDIYSCPLEFPSAGFLSNPCMFELNGLTFLMSTRFRMDFLKKRFLGTGVMSADMVIEEVPDIVITSSEKPYVKNYKSTTIISPGSLLSEFRPMVLDMKTRVVEGIEWQS